VREKYYWLDAANRMHVINHVAGGQALDIPAAFPTHTYELIIQLLSYP